MGRLLIPAGNPAADRRRAGVVDVRMDMNVGRFQQLGSPVPIHPCSRPFYGISAGSGGSHAV
jgi:hypothetical protein